jgi:hypothetical protein
MMKEYWRKIISGFSGLRADWLQHVEISPRKVPVLFNSLTNIFLPYFSGGDINNDTTEQIFISVILSVAKKVECSSLSFVS